MLRSDTPYNACCGRSQFAIGLERFGTRSPLTFYPLPLSLSPPIQLSLAGDGRLIILTAQTVKKAYYQFIEVNPTYVRSQRYHLDVALQLGSRTILDGLQSAPNVYLHAKHIRQIESELNRQVINNGLNLVAQEGQIFQGYGLCKKAGKSREWVDYIIRYGLIFILETTTASKVISMKNVDLFWQDREFDFRYVRYCGVRSSLQQQRIELLFRDRLNLSKSWTLTRDEFRPRQIFTISAIYPCEGFCLQL
jgi:hypothetical protein